MDNFIIAMSRFKRRKYDSTIELCDLMLESNPKDQAAWLLKCNSLIRKQYIDDLEIDEEGIGDILMDENSISNMAKPGTSFQKPTTSLGGLNPIMRPVTKSGRQSSGFARPGTNRPVSTASQNKLNSAMMGGRVGTSRPITSGGRYMRLATASLAQSGDVFISTDKLDLKKIAKKKAVAKSICNYMLYVENQPIRALNLAAEASQLHEYKNWWWKERLGKCYYMMGMHREAEKQFQSSLKDEDMIKTRLELSRVYVKLDQPKTAIEYFQKSLTKYPHEISFILGVGRIHDALNDPQKAVESYKQVLSYESSNLEAVANIAAYHFYVELPEISTRFYQRLLLLGINQCELWNNLAICLYYDGQYDLFESCFEKALELADEQTRPDIWYNISHIFINLGEIEMAFQCLKMVIQLDPHHPEAYNNLGILELQRGNLEKGKYELQRAIIEGELMLEPHYNAALWAFKTGEYQQALVLTKKALGIYPDHEDSKELFKKIEAMLKIM